jgi:outer membrane protein OmpA-like peptidoglycan-associated protein
VGFGFGNGLRVEAEGGYRYNDQTVGGTRFGHEEKFGGMANLLFDLDIGLPYLFPYLGGGAGYMHVDRPSHLTSNGAFAYQGMFGLAAPIAFVPGLSATLEYRFMGLADTKDSQTSVIGLDTVSTTRKYLDDYNHSIMIGLRYAFNTSPPAAVAPPSAPATAAPAPARTYLVFFDWDRSDLSDRARQIIAEAAQNSTRVQTTQIEVQGNADRSGTPAYNQRLSLRRAQTVAAELVRDGVNQSEIAIQAFGDTRPLVETAAGVREPQNRRVEIILR